MMRKNLMTIIVTSVLSLFLFQTALAQERIYFTNYQVPGGQDIVSCGGYGQPCLSVGYASNRACQESDSLSGKPRVFYYEILGGKAGSCRLDSSGYEGVKPSAEYDLSITWFYLARLIRGWFLLGLIASALFYWLSSRRSLAHISN